MIPTAQLVEDLTKETLRFELGGLIETIIDNVYDLLEGDDGVDTKNMSTEEGDIIIQTIIDTVKREIHKADELI